MKKLVLGTVAMTLLMSSGAFAQSYYDRDRVDGPRYERDRDRDVRRDDRGDFRREDRDGRWRVGGTVPYELRSGGRYIHYDWAGVGLERPPRGYQWLRIGDSYVLTDQRNGHILDVENARGRRAVWTEGGVVPAEMRSGGRYIHYDWRGAGLRRPPEGFAWMHLDNAFVLADQHTGKIIDVEPAFDRNRNARANDGRRR
ncbi:MAG: RcnB family protein [Rhodospirillaceae bacterium]